MSQVENIRPRTGQILRPGQFQTGPQGARGAGPGAQPQAPQARGGVPGQRMPDPDYPSGGVDPGYGVWGPPYPSGECGCGQCGCGSSYCGPGHGFCWYCMKTMLVNEIACLLQTDPTLQAILNAPKMGVTDGSNAQPGQVGEALSGTSVFNIPALAAGATWQGIDGPLTLPAGDWLCLAYGWSAPYEGAYFAMNNIPAGLSTDMAGGYSLVSGQDGTVIIGAPARGLVSVPTLLPFNLGVMGATGGTAAGPFNLQVQAWRMR